jgi:hypothetical protein
MPSVGCDGEMMQQTPWTTRRILWTIGVGVVGFFIGGKGGGLTGSGLGLLCGGSIGFGFGSIFDQRLATKWLLAYWGVTLALIGPFFGLIIGAKPDYSLSDQAVSGGIGAAVGMLIGLTFGAIHLWRLRRKPQVPHSDPVA